MDPSLTSLIISVLGAIGIEYMRKSFRSYSELSIAILMAGGLATAVVLMSFTQGLNKGFSAFLFGSVVAVNSTQLWILLIVAVVSCLYFFIVRRSLYVFTFDEETAQTNGVPTRFLSFSFSVLVGMSVSVSMPIVGVLLVSALMVLPAALAIMLVSGFTSTILFAIGTGLIGVMTGLVTSYKMDTPPGGTIVLVLLAFLFLGISLKKCWFWIRKPKSHKEQKDSLQEEVVGL